MGVSQPAVIKWVSIHAHPRGGRPASHPQYGAISWFQSTPSTRRATRAGVQDAWRQSVSIHALHAEGDRWRRGWCLVGLGFNPPPSTRRATGRRPGWICRGTVSIHALHAEGDQPTQADQCQPSAFQSTPSTRRATICTSPACLLSPVSIHALHAEGDAAIPNCVGWSGCFNPRPPRGGRLLRAKDVGIIALPKTIPRIMSEKSQMFRSPATKFNICKPKQIIPVIANLPGKPGQLGVRATKSGGLPGRTRAWRRHARSFVSSWSPDSRNAGCPSAHPFRSADDV